MERHLKYTAARCKGYESVGMCVESTQSHGIAIDQTVAETKSVNQVRVIGSRWDDT